VTILRLRTYSDLVTECAWSLGPNGDNDDRATLYLGSNKPTRRMQLHVVGSFVQDLEMAINNVNAAHAADSTVHYDWTLYLSFSHDIIAYTLYVHNNMYVCMSIYLRYMFYGKNRPSVLIV
jgi:hypothetical protein